MAGERRRQPHPRELRDLWDLGRPTVAGANGYGDLGFRRLYLGRSDVWTDDTYGAGLLYMHARTYVPALGRFLQPDPAEAEGNLYAYAANSPITKADPAGTRDLAIEGWGGGGGGIVVAAGAAGIWWFERVVGSIRWPAINLRLPDICLWGCGSSSTPATQWACYGRAGCVMWTTAGAAQREIERGKAPKGIERVDKRTNLPRSQDEVHVNGGAIRRDGTIKHKLNSPLSQAQKEWMRRWGFKVPL